MAPNGGTKVVGMENGSKSMSNIEINEERKVPYPKRVFFIIGNEFCERFSYHGLRTILVLYLKYKLDYTENDATVLFHGYIMIVYFMCLFGGIISDVWCGKFRTILYLSIVSSIGTMIVAISSIPSLSLSPKVTLLIGLMFVAIGSGGIKPCVSAFGGDQFKLPQQAAQLSAFFSMFYFTINSGAFISATLTPILRENVHCFGSEDCFPLAFGVPTLLMIISIVLFLSGRPSYTCVETSSENMLVQVSKCITNAISMKIRERSSNPRKNLLDYSVDKYGEQLVNDTRAMLRILVLYLPLPMFWTLFEQQGSRWTFQANRMNGNLGFYTIKPDQMQVLNPLLVLLCIPLFETVIYPIFNKLGIGRPLQRMVIGLTLTAVGFLFSALVQFRIESSFEKTVNILWLVPQYVALAMGEVMYAVTGLAFSYDQAPVRMKSVVQAFWCLTIAFGNLILLPIAKLAFFDSLAYEFLLFFVLMSVDVLIFIILACNFKSYKQIENDSNGTQEFST